MEQPVPKQPELKQLAPKPAQLKPSQLKQPIPTESASLGKALLAATADLHQVHPGAGLVRFLGLGLLTGGSLTMAWCSQDWLGFCAYALVGSLAYSFWIICNHDAIHGTLTGWRWFDAIAPRLMSWPILIPLGTYGEIHRLHHAWNGVNLQDPERVQWTATEYAQASGAARWYVRHQWAMNVLVLGVAGLIVKTFRSGLAHRERLPAVQRQMGLDVAGIALIQGGICLGLLRLEAPALVWLRYGVMLLLLERVMSLVIQGRDYLEHYGCWGKQDSHLLTQLYGTRNVKTHGIVNWLMGGLPHHGIHHAFPAIPFDQLPTAQERIAEILGDRNYPPIPQGPGYLKTSWQLLRRGHELIEN
jgi:fatty acid desaturase